MPIVNSPWGQRVVPVSNPYPVAGQDRAGLLAERERQEEAAERVGREYLSAVYRIRAARREQVEIVEQRRAELAAMRAELARLRPETTRAGPPVPLVKGSANHGQVRGYASSFGPPADSYGDIIASGAFADSLREAEVKGRRLPLLWSHDTTDPIGLWTSAREDDRGLWVEGEILSELQRGREAMALLAAGAIDGLSVGFSIEKADVDPQTGVRTITRAKLWEVSLVVFPANDRARVRPTLG